jgi:hypothetical protein
MNKKGLIFIFLFVVSTVSAIALTSAEQGDNKVEITLDYIPSAYVPSDRVYVEFDTRFIGDSQVYSSNDILNFAFFYDVAVVSFINYLYTTGYGWQANDWYYADENNASQGYTGSDLYNVTRFAGMFNLMLDDYDLGMSNFWLDEDNGNYQEIKLNLDVGWHYLTVVAAEMVSNGNHTEFHWEYAKDQVTFYVAEDRGFVPDPIKKAVYNEVSLVANEVNSENLGQYYNWTYWSDNPRPVAEAANPVYQTIPVAPEGTPVVTEVTVNYNVSDNPLELTSGSYGRANFVDLNTMGEYTYIWFVNHGRGHNLGNGSWTGEIDPVTDEQIWRIGEDQLQLYEGQNYVFFCLFGSKLDDYAQLYGEAVPNIGHDLAVMRIFVGEEVGPTGLGFGILISVSMLGLVSYAFLRKRK